jgi:ribosomal protein L15
MPLYRRLPKRGFNAIIKKWHSAFNREEEIRYNF